MWEHRNHHLHSDGSSIHQADYQSIISEIIKEWTVGVNGLSQRHHHLFQGNIHQQLNENIHLKLMWLASVWAAQDRPSCSEQLPPDPDRNSVAFSFFQRWRRRAGYEV